MGRGFKHLPSLFDARGVRGSVEHLTHADREDRPGAAYRSHHERGAVALGFSCLIALSFALPLEARASVFDEVWESVQSQFYDPELRGVDWPALKRRYAPLAKAAETQRAKARVINQMLDHLETSHTQYYTSDDTEYYQLLGIFYDRHPTLRKDLKKVRPGRSPRYTGIGIETELRGKKVFVRDVFHGAPAHDSGLKTGDELVSVDGAPFRPVESFRGKAGRRLKVRIRRASAVQEPIEILVEPAELDGRTLFLDAIAESIAVEAWEGVRVGYMRMWSFAGPQYRDRMERALLYGALKDADALVLDLRGGWGGASPSYLNVFSNRSVKWTSTSREGKTESFPSAWSKPVVLLIDGTCRSGKELLAYAFKKFGLGPVVGERTAGAVVAGTPLVLSDGSILYLAVHDAKVDSVRLEAQGVEPSVSVPFKLPYSAGADPRRTRAFEEAARLVRLSREKTEPDIEHSTSHPPQQGTKGSSLRQR